jgi:hypothetical protein
MLTGVDFRNSGAGFPLANHEMRMVALGIKKDSLDKMYLLIKLCREKDPAKRPTMAEVKDICLKSDLVIFKEVENYKAMQKLSPNGSPRI